ncbi:uncharacterized protein PG986_010735 [Apiospora aurea]|uniref:Uncharacterized protein n=1 Tax=Apiospora aurea TaxID=335848 RepID=A0ABR1Q340_9PEZI
MALRYHRILRSRAALAIRQVAYEGLAYVLLCVSLLGIFCFHFFVLALFFAAIQIPSRPAHYPIRYRLLLYLTLHSLPGLFARPLLRQSKALVVQAEALGQSEKEDPESGRCGGRHRHVQLRWIVEYWCYALDFLTPLFPDVESWPLYRWALRLVFRRQQQQFMLRLPPSGPKPVSGHSPEETQQSQFMLAEFRAGRHRPYLPRSGDLFCLYVAKVDEDASRNWVYDPMERLASLPLAIPLTASYPSWVLTFWNSLRRKLEGWWWDSLEQCVLWDMAFDLRDRYRHYLLRLEREVACYRAYSQEHML